MTQNHNLSTLVQQQALSAIANTNWQTIAYASDEPNGLRLAGVPTTGRVLVVIGYQGCETHNFIKLVELAKKENATLFVINGFPGSLDPRIQVGGQELNVTTQLKTTEDIQNVAGMIGLGGRVITSRSGEKIFSSSGSILFENGKSIARFRTTYEQHHIVHSRA